MAGVRHELFRDLVSSPRHEDLTARQVALRRFQSKSASCYGRGLVDGVV